MLLVFLIFLLKSFKETSRSNNLSLKFSLRFAKNKCTKWHFLVTNNECAHLHMALWKYAFRHAPRQFYLRRTHQLSHAPRTINRLLKNVKISHIERMTYWEKWRKRFTHLAVFFYPHWVHRTRHIFYQAHHCKFFPFPKKIACFGHRHNWYSSDS